jgi:structure-specific endonuclease subunit SLX1
MFLCFSLNLAVNFFSSKNTKFTAGCPLLPSQMKTVVCAMEDLQCSAEGPSSEEDDLSQEPQDQQEQYDSPLQDDENSQHCWQQLSDSPLRYEHSEHCWQQPSSDEDEQSGQCWLQPLSDQAQPMVGQTGIAGPDVEEDSVDEFGPRKWSEILDIRTEVDEPRTSPRCSSSLSGDVCGTAMEDEQGDLSSSWLMFGTAGTDGGGGHIPGGSADVVDLVTPTPVDRLRRGGCVASVCPKIIDLTSSPVVIQL